MTTSVRFCLSYDPLELDYIAFEIDNISSRKRIVDTDFVNDVTRSRQSVITRVVIRFLLHDFIHWIILTSYDKYYFYLLLKLIPAIYFKEYLFWTLN